MTSGSNQGRRPKPAPPVFPPKGPAAPPEAGAAAAAGFGYADKFEEAGLQRRVSEAIGRHLGLVFDEKERAAVRAEAGEEGLALVREIDGFANRMEFWTKARSHDRAYEEIQRQLRDKYPFLSEAAITRLATRAAWGWR